MNIRLKGGLAPSRRGIIERRTAVLVAAALIATGISMGGTISGVISDASAVPLAVDVAYQELQFPISRSSIESGNPLVAGGQRRYTNVITVGSTVVDAVVTTVSPANFTITDYDNPGSASANADYFQINATTTSSGHGTFQFDFYESGTDTPVSLSNLQITGIDIDSSQYNSFTNINSYTVATATHLIANQNPVRSPVVPVVLGGGGSFVGNTGNGSNVPLDQVVLAYGDATSLSVTFGSYDSGSNPNYFGLAFMALAWGSSTPTTTAASTTLTYDGNGPSGGTVPATATQAFGSLLTLASNSGGLSKPGYTFGGWNTANDASGTSYAAASSYTFPNVNSTLFAVWNGSYSLSYNVNGGSGGPASPETRVTGASANLSSTDPTFVGFTFAGWNTAADGSGTAYSSGASYTMPAGNRTLYAIWAGLYTLTYDANGGSGGPSPSSDARTNGTTAALSATAPTRTGYVFGGWRVGGAGTVFAAGAAFTMPAAATTLVALWNAQSFALTYDANGGVGSPSGATVVAGTTVTVSATVPTKSGYTFSGWLLNGTGGALVASATFTMPGMASTLTAQWTATGGGGDSGGGSSGGGSNGAGSGTSTPSATASPAGTTTAPGVGPVKKPDTEKVQPGNDVTLINGEPVQTEKKTVDKSTRIEISGPDFKITVGGTSSAGQPLPLSAGGAPVVTTQERLATSGYGCAPGTIVELYLLTPLTSLGSIAINVDGAFSGSVGLPAGLPAGDYVMQTNCFTTTAQVRSVSVGLTVRSASLVLCTSDSSGADCTKAQQRPRKGFLLPDELVAGRNLLLPTRVRMNSGRFADVSVLCSPVTRSAPIGDVAYCQTNLIGTKTYVLVRPDMRMNAKVIISAPATSKYAAYRYTKSYSVR